DDLDLRMAQHQTGALGGYTAARRPVALVWSESFQTRDDAYAVECKLKGWSRAKKEALIAGDWERIRHLAQARRHDSAAPSASSGGAAWGIGADGTPRTRSCGLRAIPTPAHAEPVEARAHPAPAESPRAAFDKLRLSGVRDRGWEASPHPLVLSLSKHT